MKQRIDYLDSQANIRGVVSFLVLTTVEANIKGMVSFLVLTTVEETCLLEMSSRYHDEHS